MNANNANSNTNTKYVSFGYRCSSAGLLRRLGVREESHPFDWMVSRLPVIQHCIETDFSQFLPSDTTEYANKSTSTVSYNPDSGEREIFVCDEKVWHNLAYMGFAAPSHMSKHWAIDRDTYAYPMAFNHHNMMLAEVQQYFIRCIDRFRAVLESNANIRFLYIHPIHDTDEHFQHCDSLIRDFIQFYKFIQSATKEKRENKEKEKGRNIRGLFVMPIRTKYEYPITDKYVNPVEVVLDEPDFQVVCLYCNRDIVDAGEIWYRNGYIEEDQILRKISEYFNIGV